MRYPYIDNAKGFAMLLVIWAHINSSGPLATFAYSFHMPVFFLISGLMYKSAKYPNFSDYVRVQFKSLLIPYAVYSFVWWLIWVIYSLASHSDVASYWRPLLQTIVAQGSQDYLVHNTALWFVPCLVAVKLMYYFIEKTPVCARLVFCCGLAALNLLVINHFPLWKSLPWNFDTALMAIPFYCLGNLVGNVGQREMTTYVNSHKLLMTLSCLVVFACLMFSAFNGGERISMGHSYYGKGVIAFYLKAVSGSVALVLFSMLMTPYLKWGIVNHIGRKSFDYMATNVPVKGIMIVMYCKILGIPQLDVWAGVAHSIVPFILTFLVCTCLTFVADFIRGKIYA